MNIKEHAERLKEKTKKKKRFNAWRKGNLKEFRENCKGEIR